MSPPLPPVARPRRDTGTAKGGFCRCSNFLVAIIGLSILDDAARAATVPVHGKKPLKRGTLQAILRQSGITAVELARLL